MDSRVLDVLTGVASLLVFVLLLVVLPGLMKDSLGIAYMLAFVLFLITMSGAGYIINKKIA
jgi:putative flippase GtrA